MSIRKDAYLQVFLDGPGWNRTNDLGIKSPLLYQLSYRPAPSECRSRRAGRLDSRGRTLPT